MGGTLDLLLVDHKIQVEQFKVTPKNIGNSDHFFSNARLNVPRQARPANEDRWRCSKNAKWEVFIKELEHPLAIWHHWLRKELQTTTAYSDKEQARKLLREADLSFTVLVLGTLWKTDTTYGNFVAKQSVNKVATWWNEECQSTLAALRKSRGHHSYSQALRDFSNTVRRARKSGWKQKVNKLQETAPETIPELHRHVRDFFYTHLANAHP